MSTARMRGVRACSQGDSDVITGSIARSATRRYLIYSEADFEVFRPAGATRCTPMEVKFGMEERRGPKAPPLCQISPPSVQRLGYRTSKLKLFTEI